jgi:hypothetical protein
VACVLDKGGVAGVVKLLGCGDKTQYASLYQVVQLYMRRQLAGYLASNTPDTAELRHNNFITPMKRTTSFDS